MTAATSIAAPRRLASIDYMRGLVMIVMALDHVRDFVHSGAPFADPLSPDTSTPALFLTRFITHYCAPTFIFLAGVSAELLGERLGDKGKLARFLVSRGVWLAFLEITVVSFAWQFGYMRFLLGVIWVIGLSMIVLAGAIYLPRRAVLALGAVIILGHNLLDGITPDLFGDYAFLWAVIHQPYKLPWGIPGLIGYPLLPWLGVMFVGYGIADQFQLPAAVQRRRFALAGTALTVAFFALRGFNHYGDPTPWVAHDTMQGTIFSFFHVLKYPPSLDYLLITLGPGLIALSALEGLPATGAVGRVLLVFGRVPTFYYVAHLYLGHLIGYVMALAYGSTPQPLMFNGDLPDPTGEGWRLELPGTYLVWLIVVVGLYLPCRWFAGVKARRKDWWLSYL
jgi:uncharacterized membrane protein